MSEKLDTWFYHVRSKNGPITAANSLPCNNRPIDEVFDERLAFYIGLPRQRLPGVAAARRATFPGHAVHAHRTGPVYRDGAAPPGPGRRFATGLIAVERTAEGARTHLQIYGLVDIGVALWEMARHERVMVVTTQKFGN